MWVFFTLIRYSYPSISSTTSVCADSSILEIYKVLWSPNYAPEMLHCYAAGRVDRAMPCHHTGYDRHDIHIL